MAATAEGSPLLPILDEPTVNDAVPLTRQLSLQHSIQRSGGRPLGLVPLVEPDSVIRGRMLSFLILSLLLMPKILLREDISKDRSLSWSPKFCKFICNCGPI